MSTTTANKIDMLLLKRSPLTNCWVCNECETENSLSAHYCEVCGRPMNFNAIAFMPSTQRSLSWVSSAGFSNFVIQDRNY